MSIVALTISFLALGFTTYSFWWMNWRKGKLQVANVRTYAAVASGNTLVIELPLVFFNPGAMPILIENLRLIFPDRGGPHTCLSFNATVDRLGTDEGRSMATPFAIHKGEARLLICEFHRMRAGFRFERENYNINLEARVCGNDWKTIKKIQLEVRESQVVALNSSLVAHDNEPQLSSW